MQIPQAWPATLANACMLVSLLWKLHDEYWKAYSISCSLKSFISWYCLDRFTKDWPGGIFPLQILWWIWWVWVWWGRSRGGGADCKGEWCHCRARMHSQRSVPWQHLSGRLCNFASLLTLLTAKYLPNSLILRTNRGENEICLYCFFFNIELQSRAWAFILPT